MAHVFPIAPAGMQFLWILAPIALIFLVVMTLLGVSLLGARNARFEVSAEGLRIRGDLYGRVVPVTALRINDARRADLESEADLKPRVRTFGTGLPGYQSGWFRLGSGEKALVYLTDRSKAVYVPTARGYSMLLSPDDPEEFLAALRALDR